ncbi:hypothetical protein JW921_03010 [Candidatus Fermentibacterales bacterium]|nr:hypothetical protein [Candidatus Fermentibacterales bacterium]
MIAAAICLCILLILLEELYQWVHAERLQGSAWVIEPAAGASARDRILRHMRYTRFMRSAELLLLGFVWTLAGAAVSGRVFDSQYGQLASLLLLLQLLRLLGRSVIRRWTIWINMEILEVGFLVALLLRGHPSGEIVTASPETGWAWAPGLSSVFAAAGLAVASCFAITYLMRRAVPTRSHFFEELPSMALSLEWMARMAAISLPFAILTPLLVLARPGAELLAALPFVLAALLDLFVVLETRQVRNPHRLGPACAGAVLGFLLLVMAIGWGQQLFAHSAL